MYVVVYSFFQLRNHTHFEMNPSGGLFLRRKPGEGQPLGCGESGGKMERFLKLYELVFLGKSHWQWLNVPGDVLFHISLCDNSVVGFHVFIFHSCSSGWIHVRHRVLWGENPTLQIICGFGWNALVLTFSTWFCCGMPILCPSGYEIRYRPRRWTDLSRGS